MGEFVKDDVVDEEVVENVKQQPAETVEPKKNSPSDTNATTAVEVTPTVATPATAIDQTVVHTVTDEEPLKGAGSRVEGIKTVDGKIRPISKVEGSVITNEVKLVAELAEKVGKLGVTP